MAGLSLDDVLPLRLATVTFPADHPLRGQRGDVLGFAVRRRDDRLVLFDTGVGDENRLIERHYRPTRRPLDAELARHGHRLADVAAIVNSHLHFDHCGGNPLFPGVPIYVQATELAASRDPWYTVRDWVDFDGVEYRTIDGPATVADDIEIIPSPGHTGGHQSLVLDTREGTVVLAGQAIYSSNEYEFIRDHDALPADDPPPDPAGYLQSARRLIRMNPIRVHFSHDARVWEPQAR